MIAVHRPAAPGESGNESSVCRGFLRGALVGLLYASLALPAAAIPRGPLVDELSTLALANAVANGTDYVTILAIVKPEAKPQFDATLLRLRARKLFEDRGLGIVSATVPTSQFGALASSPALDAIAVDETPYRREQFDCSYPDASQLPPALANGSSLREDLQSDAFLTRDGRFDGRGTVIAHIESAIPDFTRPELRQAKSLNGNAIPKYLDIVSIPDEKGDGARKDAAYAALWVKLTATADSNGWIHILGKRLKAPTADSRAGVLRVPSALLTCAGNYPTSIAKGAAYVDIPVAWLPRTGQAIVDGNLDNDFSNDERVGVYGRTHEIGLLDGKTHPARGLGYVVQDDTAHDYLGINFGRGGHVTLTGTAAAASLGRSGKIEGAAPGAQLLLLAPGDSLLSYARALVTAVSDPRTDVVFMEGRGDIMDNSDPNDGTSVLGVLIQRLAARYPKPVLVTAFNGDAMQSTMDASVPSAAVSIGYAISAKGILNTTGARLDYPLEVGGSSHGPGGNGALKPDLVAPASFMSIASKGRYHPCGGSSCATPVAAGAMALLVGAQKLSGNRADPLAIVESMKATARPLPQEGSYMQGRGIIQVDDAWADLQRNAPRKSAIQFQAPVVTVSSHRLTSRGTGMGLYEREGWQRGVAQDRTVQIVRKGGRRGFDRCSVDWIGDRSSFSSESEISLPLDEAAKLLVHVMPGEGDVSSAILRIKCSDGIAGEMLATIVTPQELLSDMPELTRSVKIPVGAAGRSGRVFFKVPPGTQALKVAYKSQSPYLRMRLYRPNGVWEFTPSLPKADLIWRSPVLVEDTVVAPEAGVWEATFQSSALALQSYGTNIESDEVELTVAALGVTITQDKRANGGPQVQLNNRLAALPSVALKGALGATRTTAGSIRKGEMKAYDVLLPPGTSILMTRLKATTDGLRQHLYFCERGACTRRVSSNEDKDETEIVLSSPAAGSWRIIVDATRQQSSDAAFELTDIYAHPSFGGVLTADASHSRTSGASWTVPIEIWDRAAIPSGRQASALLYLDDPSLHGVQAGVKVTAGEALAGIKYPVLLGIKELDRP